MVADAADQYLIKIANHINVLDSFERSPKQLKDAYNESKKYILICGDRNVISCLIYICSKRSPL